MADASLRVLLDQNVPRQISGWLLSRRPDWEVFHAADVGLSNRPDAEVFAWAQDHHAVVVTFDEDFADTRMFPLGSHHGVVRLRVWPTTIEETQVALDRLLSFLPDQDWSGSLIIVDAARIRVRRQAGR